MIHLLNAKNELDNPLPASILKEVINTMKTL